MLVVCPGVGVGGGGCWCYKLIGALQECQLIYSLKCVSGHLPSCQWKVFFCNENLTFFVLWCVGVAWRKKSESAYVQYYMNLTYCITLNEHRISLKVKNRWSLCVLAIMDYVRVQFMSCILCVELMLEWWWLSSTVFTIKYDWWWCEDDGLLWWVLKSFDHERQLSMAWWKKILNLSHVGVLTNVCLWI